MFTSLLADPRRRSLVPCAELVKGYEYLIKPTAARENYDLKTRPANASQSYQFEQALPISANQRRSNSSELGHNIYATETSEPVVVYRGPRFGTCWRARADDRQHRHRRIRQARQETYVTVWKGTNLFELLCGEWHPPNQPQDPYAFLNNFTFAVKKDTTYFMRLDSAEAEGEYSLTCAFRSDAPNDNLWQALAISLAAVQYDNGIRYTNAVHANNYGASTEAGEPLDLQRTVCWGSAPSAGYLIASATRWRPSGESSTAAPSPGPMERRLSDN